MTAFTAKRMIRNELVRLDLPPYKLTARRVDFIDLARASCIFVKIHGWENDPLWHKLADLATNNKFRIE